jgi:pyridoxine kinase
VLDPVMGDDGKIYVSPTIPPLYRDVLLPLADIVTPNQFEAEYVNIRVINFVVVK